MQQHKRRRERKHHLLIRSWPHSTSWKKNSNLNTAVIEANQEVARLKKDKENLTDEVGSLEAKKGELEAYLGQLAEKLVLKLEGISFCPTD